MAGIPFLYFLLSVFIRIVKRQPRQDETDPTSG